MCAHHARARRCAPRLEAFEGISRSSRHKAGLALRFPRSARWRGDKPAAEADSLERVRALLPETAA
jgi:DNA ligase-1